MRRKNTRLFDEFDNLKPEEYSKYRLAATLDKQLSLPSMMEGCDSPTPAADLCRSGWKEVSAETVIPMVVEFAGTNCMDVCCPTGQHCVDGVLDSAA